MRFFTFGMHQFADYVALIASSDRDVNVLEELVIRGELCPIYIYILLVKLTHMLLCKSSNLGKLLLEAT